MNATKFVHLLKKHIERDPRKVYGKRTIVELVNTVYTKLLEQEIKKDEKGD